MKKVAGIMIAKGESTRLHKKNQRIFCNRPLYEWNLEKLLNIGIDVYFESDNEHMLEKAKEMGAHTILRPPELRGHNVPSVPLFQNIVANMSYTPDAVINIQANSPNTSKELLFRAVKILQTIDCTEILTFYPDLRINGSLWGFSYNGLMNYQDPYVHNPDILLLDNAIDIHLETEFEEAEELFKQENNI